ncbi:MAG: hypothetical protein K8I30_22890 [Anaerolineae bacterium]|nr:hypothetical protein [Anaerolineae bacterium]
MNRWIDYSQAEKRLAGFLNFLTVVLIVSSLLILIAPYLFRDAPLFIAPPFFVTNTIAGLALLAFLAWCSAADVRRFRAMLYVLIGGLLIGAGAFLGLSRPITGVQDAPLLIGFALCSVTALGVAGLVFQAKMPQAPWLPWIPDKPLNQWENITRVVFGLFGLASLGAAAASVLLPYLGVTLINDLAVSPFMIAGSTIKLGLLGMCALLIALDVRQFTHHTQMITALVVGNAA